MFQVKIPVEMKFANMYCVGLCGTWGEMGDNNRCKICTVLDEIAEDTGCGYEVRKARIRIMIGDFERAEIKPEDYTYRGKVVR
jgi:hypothetical protein